MCASDGVSSPPPEKLLWWCSENCGKFEQLRLQLEFWAELLLRACPGQTDLEDVSFSAEDDLYVAISVRFRDGRKARARVERRADVAQQLGPEPQCESMVEIAKSKVRAAAQVAAAQCATALPRPQTELVGVAVQDSGLSIRALNGFPGPFTKYVTQTIGMRGLLKLMEGQADRACGFDGCVAFAPCGRDADDGGGVRLFREPRQHWGRLATWAESGLSENVDSAGGVESSTSKWTVAPQAAHSADAARLSGADRNAFTVFIPEDLPRGSSAAGKTLAGMPSEDLRSYRRSRHSSYRDFARFVFVEVLGCGAALALISSTVES